MNTTRIRCPKPALIAAYKLLGFSPPGAQTPEVPDPAGALAGTELVDDAGGLTDVAKVIIPLLAHQSRVVSAVATSPGESRIRGLSP